MWWWRQAVVRVEEERAELYEALKRRTSVPMRLSFYEQFHIPASSRKKKRRVRRAYGSLLRS